MMGRSPTEYGLWFIPTAGGYILGNIITSRLSVRFGVDAMIFWGNIIEPDRHGASALLLLPFVDAVGPLVHRRAGDRDGYGERDHSCRTAIAGAVSVRPQAAGTASGITRLHADVVRRA